MCTFPCITSLEFIERLNAQILDEILKETTIVNQFFYDINHLFSTNFTFKISYPIPLVGLYTCKLVP